MITGGHELPNEHVIHCLGPVYGRDTPEDELLAACYRNALAKAEQTGIGSVGFPAISTGAFGYPMREAAEVMLGTFGRELPQRELRLVRVVLHGVEALEIHREVAKLTLDG